MTKSVSEPDYSALRNAAYRAHRDGKDTALAAYARYLALAPDDAAAWSNLGALHRSQGRHMNALRAQARAHDLAPDDPAYRNNYANILSDVGQYDESIALRETILGEQPDDTAQKALIARCLRGKGDYKAAVAYLKDAIKEHPDVAELRMQLALAQLGAGDYKTGFETYRARWDTGEITKRTLPYPEWNGEPLKGNTVLVVPEQGFGDAILFARFVPSLKAAGARVVYLAEDPVLPLFVGLKGASWVSSTVTITDEIDCWMSMMDMARLHFASSKTIPAPAKLSVPEDAKVRAAKITEPFEDKFKVGVVWTGSKTYKGNAFRSFSHTDLQPLLDIPDVQLFSLYKGPDLDKFHADGTSAFIVDTASSDRHFGDCAGTMEQMDLVISSDTATLHLAGSLGVPTWAVLHWDPFWVWRHKGTQTKWYPKMRLFRQRTPLDWAPVMKKIRDALVKELETPND